MSIELKQAAQQAIDAFEARCGTNADERQPGGVIAALRTAIQQAASEPVAVRNPFASRCYTMSESHLSGHRLIVGFEKLEDAQDAHEWVSRQGRSNPGELPGMWHESDLIGGETDCEPSRPPHPAPGVPRSAVNLGAHSLASELAQAVAQDDADPEGHDMSAGLFGPTVSAWLRKVAADFLSHPAPGVPDGWTDADADAARLAMELECLLLDTKDTAAVSRWWKSANEALDLHRARLAAAMLAASPTTQPKEPS